MATFEIIEGMPGQGKSLYTARKTMQILKRNRRWYEKQMKDFEEEKTDVEPLKRKVAINIKLAEHVEEEFEDYLRYWVGIDEVIELRHVDLVWDEIATHLDARRFSLVSDEVLYFLSQHRKRGIEIYANTQDFSMIDARARIMATSVKSLRKIIGSPDPSPTKPPIKTIWGLIWIRSVVNYKETDPEKKKYDFFSWSFFLIEKELVELYDTLKAVQRGEMPPLKHITRKCEHCDDENHSCNHTKIVHL